jgi:hypothetical protein
MRADSDSISLQLRLSPIFVVSATKPRPPSVPNIRSPGPRITSVPDTITITAQYHTQVNFIPGDARIPRPVSAASWRIHVLSHVCMPIHQVLPTGIPFAPINPKGKFQSDGPRRPHTCTRHSMRDIQKQHVTSRLTQGYGQGKQPISFRVPG